MGYFCPQASETPTACPIGTFSNKTLNTDIANCTACSPGKFCMHRGMTTEGTNCTAGYYCPTGVPTSTPTNYVCQEGNYCPAGVQAPIPCALGFYQPYKMQASCLPCEASYYCDVTGMYAQKLCPAGKYCPANTVNPMDCPVGTYSDLMGLSAVSECKRCPSGKYCSTTGATSESFNACGAGYFCDITTLTDLTIGFTIPNPITGLCPAGSYCLEGSTSPL